MLRTVLRAHRPLVKQRITFLHLRTISTHEAFSYTSGRWIVDEPARLAERYQHFNIEALKAVAASAGQAASVVAMSKFGVEGVYSKSFLMTLDTGHEVVANVPNPLYGPTHPLLASEVATMEYARGRLGAPIPRVLDWCTDRHSTPVEAAYMVTEKPAGVVSEDVWHMLDISRKLQITEQIASIEQGLDKGVFPAFGSLYRRVDIKKGERYVEIPGDDVYVVGCSAALPWWKDGRKYFDTIRGPWTETKEYLLAPAIREYKWLSEFAQSRARPRWALMTRQEVNRDVTEFLDMLELYASVIVNFIPTEGTYTTALVPTLRHPDLDLYNIYVSVTNDQVKVTSLVDWSHSYLGPRYVHLGIPRFLWLPELPGGAERPTDLPPDFAELKEEDQVRIQKETDITKCRTAYENIRNLHDPTLAHLYGNFLFYRLRAMMTWSSNIWNNNYVPIRRGMVDIQRAWPNVLPSVPCPIKYTPDEQVTFISEALAMQERDDIITDLEHLFRASREGLVFTHNYEASKELVALAWEKLATEDDPDVQMLREIWPWERS